MPFQWARMRRVHVRMEVLLRTAGGLYCVVKLSLEDRPPRAALVGRIAPRVAEDPHRGPTKDA